ncbi:MAG: phage tail protein [Gammaproteobacteria bacterium]|nr:phage tail protein [Gammaproteobacteria bacterium]
MAEPFLAEIRLFSFQFPPRGWALCNGQLLPINQNQALFSLLGTNFGGDGRVNFALPNLQSRAPLHAGPNFVLGQSRGEAGVTLNLAAIPNHSHLPFGSSGAAISNSAAAAPLAIPGGRRPIISYGNPTAFTPLSSTALSSVGGGQAHPNTQPYLTLNFCIALQGIYPSPN